MDEKQAAAWSPPSPLALLTLLTASGVFGAVIGAVVAHMECSDGARAEREGAYRRGFMAGHREALRDPGAAPERPSHLGW